MDLIDYKNIKGVNMELKELEQKREAYNKVLSEATKVAGEETQLIAEKDRITKQLLDAGYKSKEELEADMVSTKAMLESLNDQIEQALGGN